MHGSANVSLDPEDIAKLKISLIPISAQKKVVSIIDKINDIKQN
jgi:hypothetical protein